MEYPSVPVAMEPVREDVPLEIRYIALDAAGVQD